MISDKFVILGAAIGFIGGASYIISTLKGRTKPNRVSWLIWAIAPMVAFTAEINQGVGLRSLVTFMAGFTPALVILASFANKKSFWQLRKFDYVCGLLALAGVAAWAITGKGNAAIFFSILADGLAALPTIVKAYIYPETENHLAFTLFIFNSGITLLTIDKWTFENWGFPLYLFVMNILLAALIKFKLGKKLHMRRIST